MAQNCIRACEFTAHVGTACPGLDAAAIRRLSVREKLVMESE